MESNSINFESILNDKESLNLQHQQKRLILLALIKSDFKVKVAFEINCKDSYYTFDAYDKLWRKYFPIGIRDLKAQYYNSLKK